MLGNNKYSYISIDVHYNKKHKKNIERHQIKIDQIYKINETLLFQCAF